MRLFFAGALVVLCTCTGMSQAADRTYSTVLPPSTQQGYGTGLRPGSRYWNYQANATGPQQFASHANDAHTDRGYTPVGQPAADATAAEAPEADEAYGSGAVQSHNGCAGSCGSHYGVGGFGCGTVAGGENFNYRKDPYVGPHPRSLCSSGGCCDTNACCDTNRCCEQSPACGDSHGCRVSCCGGHPLDASCYGLDTCARPRWFAGVYGLILDHDDDDGSRVLAVDGTASSVPALSTDLSQLDNSGGIEVRLGRYLNDCWALEASYWGWYPDMVESNLNTNFTPGNILSTINFNGLEINDGAAITPVNTFYTNAQRMRLRRSYEAHNVELNFLYLPFAPRSCSRIALLAGARYLKLDEGLQFSTDLTTSTFGDDLVNEVDYGIDVKNQLVGLQLGALVDHYFTCCLSGHMKAKLGVYANEMQLRSSIRNGQQNTANINVGPNAGQLFAINNTQTDVAFAGEFALGMSYDLTSCWRATIGYRAIVLSGVALAGSQIPSDFTDLASAANINDHDAFVLHGTYLGAEYNW